LVMAIEQTAPPQPITNPELPAGASASLERHTGKGEGRMHIELGSRIVNGRIAMKASSLTAVVMNQNQSKIGLDMDMDVTSAPGPTPGRPRRAAPAGSRRRRAPSPGCSRPG